MTEVWIPEQQAYCENLIGGAFAPGSGEEREIISPYTGAALSRMRLSTAADVDDAVQKAQVAWLGWRRTPLRERLEPLARFRAALLEELEPLSKIVAAESGKTPAEARAGVLRGIEVIEFALSLQNSDSGGALDVSRGVSCEYRRDALGVVVGITPFNFPAMVPLWMFPIALSVGNTFILKPSEKVPLAASYLGDLALRAGYPPGVFSVVHGDRVAVQALVSHPFVQAVAFVGSSQVARSVYAEAAAAGKRALCLGGAKNQLIVTPDADPQLTAKAVVDSFTGCAGQRCMAGSLLLAVDEGARLLEPIKKLAASITLGAGMGALIDRGARDRLVGAIARAEAAGVEVSLDGRQARVPAEYADGYWLGPTILDRVTVEHECAKEELFGPILSVIRVPTLEAALAIERANPYGNATSVFTSSGAVARHVAERASSGMIGVNVGVPVPREPFSFGGTKLSKFGHGDITGPSAVEFWTDLKKITSKWAAQVDATWMS
ncbi:MAG: methylmalonate-semialdehyde dehydrogenase [Pseudomonadota bacterium]|jgi:malonate-semialdehyde dehydrogenase (acetylating)/methylmalonate-semialdehyde dehydrogenase